MNFDSDKDLSRLVKICNLYGLDEEETNQLITEFRIGALSGNNN